MLFKMELFSDIIENVTNVSEVTIDHIIHPSGRVTPGQIFAGV